MVNRLVWYSGWCSQPLTTLNPFRGLRLHLSCDFRHIIGTSSMFWVCRRSSVPVWSGWQCFPQITPQRLTRCVWTYSWVWSDVWIHTQQHRSTTSCVREYGSTGRPQSYNYNLQSILNWNTKQFDWVVVKLKKKGILWLMNDHNIYCTKFTRHPPPFTLHYI